MPVGERETRKLLQALVSVDKTEVSGLLSRAYESGGVHELGEILRKALEEIGIAWDNGTMSLAQVYMSGIIGEEAVQRILPHAAQVNDSLPKIGTAVFLDHHGLGMRIVSSLVRSAGYPLKDLGLGADIDRIVDFVRREEIRILLISVLMLPSALAVADLTREMAVRHPGVKIIVGGAPFRLDENLWKQAGAHGMGKNAGEIFHILADLQKDSI